jgi:hypothetical protein
VFTPDELKINAGDTVEWRNIDGFHNVNGTQTTYPTNPESFGNNTGVDWTYSHVFKVPGTYDYQCDPHVNLGMVGKIEVKSESDDINILTINFSGMTPHDGQKFFISVVERNSAKEIERKVEDIGTDFSVQISGIEKDHSYFIIFFADHNGNGIYDAPPVDHAWRLELNDVVGDTTLNFVHNTNFTDIMWQNRLTVNFTGMNPHEGQSLNFRLVDKDTGTEIFRTSTIVTPEFNIYAYGIEKDKSYNVDFYSDHNGNGMYDAPPADHAWRLELNDVVGDTTLYFVHNTNFTNIEITTGINIIEPIASRIYPNPASTYAKIDLTRYSEEISIVLINISGIKQKLYYEVVNGTMELNLTSLRDGIYFVQIIDKETHNTFKLIKK